MLTSAIHSYPGLELSWRGAVVDSTASRMMEQRRRAQRLQREALWRNQQNLADYERTRGGWQETIQRMASRIAELSVLANDSTKQPLDRAALQTEIDHLQQGIRSITSGPYAMGRFNGLFLFQG